MKKGGVMPPNKYGIYNGKVNPLFAQKKETRQKKKKKTLVNI